MPLELSRKRVVARKPHKCFACSTIAVQPGDEYTRSSNLCDGRVYSLVTCTACAEMLSDDRVVKWPTYRPVPMHAATERFVSDLRSGRITHDGCPITSLHMANARMEPRKDGRYMLAKPDAARKIDAAVTTVLVHEAAADARAAGWDNETDSRMSLDYRHEDERARAYLERIGWSE